MKDNQAKLERLYQKALRIGLATDQGFDAELVRKLTDKHRELHGFSKAKVFKVYPSPSACQRENLHKGVDAASAFYGQTDISWLILAEAGEKVYGKKGLVAPLKYLLELTKHVGWFWMSEEETLVTPKPSEIHLLKKANGVSVLHNPKGLALAYKDGTGVYAVDGVRVPLEDQPAFLSQDPKQYLQVKNAEVRSALLRSLSPEEFVTALEPKVLQTLTLGPQELKYSLLEITLDGQRRVYLDMTCPSKGTRHVEAVPPETASVEAALAWREEDDGSYQIPELRT